MTSKGYSKSGYIGGYISISTVSSQHSTSMSTKSPKTFKLKELCGEERREMTWKTYKLKEPCGEGCEMTWRVYNATMQMEEQWDITTTICHGVYEHPHLSDERVFDKYGFPFDWPIHWIVGEMCDDSDAPHGKTQLDVLKHVVENGANVNRSAPYTGHTPLMEAKNAHLFEFLMSKGANVTKRDCNGGTILHRHVRMCEMDIIADILHIPEVAYLIPVKDNKGRTALDIMDDYQRKEYPAIVNLFS